MWTNKTDLKKDLWLDLQSNPCAEAKLMKRTSIDPQTSNDNV